MNVNDHDGHEEHEAENIIYSFFFFVYFVPFVVKIRLLDLHPLGNNIEFHPPSGGIPTIRIYLGTRTAWLCADPYSYWLSLELAIRLRLTPASAA
jgi:hypothetical protein